MHKVDCPAVHPISSWGRVVAPVENHGGYSTSVAVLMKIFRMWHKELTRVIQLSPVVLTYASVDMSTHSTKEYRGPERAVGHVEHCCLEIGE